MMKELLLDPNYRRYLLARTISQVGDRLRDMVILYWVFAQDPSPLTRMLTVTAEFGPILLVATIAGALADRLNRKRLMVLTDLASFVVTLGQLIAVYLGNIWLCLGLTAVNAALSQFTNAAGLAYVPEILGKERMAAGVGISQTVGNLTMLVGPPLGTILFFSFGAYASFSLQALGFITSALLVSRIRISGQPPARPVEAGVAGLLGDIVNGFRYATNSPMARGALITLGVLFLGAGALNTLNIYFFTEALGVHEKYMTVSTTIMSASMLASSFLFANLAKRLNLHRMFIGGIVTVAVGMGLGPIFPFLWVVCFGSALSGWGNAALNIGLNTLLMQAIDPGQRGRFFGLFQPLMVIGTLVSAAIGSWAYALVGIRPVIFGSALMILVGGLVAAPSMRPRPATPLPTEGATL